MSPMLARLRDLLTESRFIANVTVTYGVIVVLVLLSLVGRWLLGRSGERLSAWTGLRSLDGFGREAAQRSRRLLARLTWAAVILLTIAGIVYHALGRDVRQDFLAWYADIIAERWLRRGLRAAGVLALIIPVTWVGTRLVRRLRGLLEPWVASRIGTSVSQEAIARWFTLLQRFANVAVCLGAMWVATHVVGFVHLADRVIGFVLYMTTVVIGARLLALAAQAATRVGAHTGDRYLADGKFKNYWGRVKLLFPFGERCLEAAIYIKAAALLAEELRYINVVAVYGTPLVQCIGIFFVTRVLIELAYVLLHEAFGLYKEGKVARDQKGRTLVPLLHSVSQYVLYFGAGIAMLQVFGVDATPILAGAGILGLAVGLGAQSLVTDVVSGFFILFEAQYLVGDFVRIGDATGVVEAVGIRVTQVRDARGKLHLIPNGQIKGVVNYSKGYINAVVDVKVPSGSDLEATFRRMAEAGRRLKEKHEEVLADTEIQGVVELGTSEMTVRAVTKVQPGTHEAMENAYRHLLKQVFDEAAPAGQLKVAA